MIWRAKDFTFPDRVLVMGIVNVTPDSFSDGGRYYDPAQAIAHALDLVQQGADLLDIGGESTRPRAAEVPADEELRRVLPVIRALREQTSTPISIDTRKVSVAREALAAGASVVNDVAANRSDPEMWRTVAEFGAGYVLMHMKGTPATMQEEPRYEDVVREVGEFFAERLPRVESCGVARENIALDPGIGFGKTLEHNLELLAGLKRFTIHARPVVLGVSRKSFIGKLLGTELDERLPGSLAGAIWGALNGVRIVRAHEVRATRQALQMIAEIAARER